MSGSVLLYLVRHAIAEERGSAWPDDRLRPLTDDGRRRMARQVQGLVQIDVAIDEILASPLVRTRQTADILSEGLRGHPPVIDFAPLEPGNTAKDLLAALKPFKGQRQPRLALVGHEPGIGELAAALLGTRQTVCFKKGAVALFEVDTLPPSVGSGELRWFLAPRILRHLGKGA